MLGIPGAMLGTVWPSIRQTFHLTHEAAGLLLMAKFFSYFAGSFASGKLCGLMGTGRLLALAAILMCGGLAGMAAAPFWLLIVAASGVVGLGQGALDGGVNIYAAARFSPRWLNWLHASFGVGSTITPGLGVFAIGLAGSWRGAYWASTALAGVLVILFLWTMRDWDVREDESAGGVSLRETLRLPSLWIFNAVFLLLAGLEMTAGQWLYSLFTEARHASPAKAAFGVSVFWGAFTVGRIFFGWVVERVPPRVLIPACTAGAALGAIGLYWHAGVVVALAVLGFSVAPLFAMWIGATGEQFGPRHAANAIGIVIAASSVGQGVMPALGGVLASTNLELIPLFIAAHAVLLFVLSVYFRAR